MAESKSVYEPVKPDVSLPGQEKDILRFWDQHQIFQKTLDTTADKKPYSFYDGPPFATGLPHYGHLLAGILKDIVPRYWTMRGYHVPRRFGWDCHGLPVEYEINKKLGLDSRKQILAMGVDKYNAECRSIVQRYTEEWKSTVHRIGRWVDMDHPYFTMDPAFMQSVWWVFRQLWDKGLIYEGHKVVPYSVGVSTPLSNFEANLNYKDVQDPSITITLKVEGRDDTYFLAWTTTPWTLPSNLALAAGADIDYVEVEDPKTGHTYILAAALRDRYFGDDAPVRAQHKGSELAGMRYLPLLPYFADQAAEGAFRVITSDHVTVETGTGLVHIAPAFGEDDYEACRVAGIPLVNPVDDDGMFTDEVPDWAGRRVKDADKDIIARLKADGTLFRHETIEHSYPFCWRSDTPLIYRAVSTWFVKVESMRDALLAANAETRWVPEHLKDGRFGKWLENARDWAVSRNRFWGTPLPIWKNDEGEVVCVGSIDELYELSGTRVDDLHLDVIGEIEIPSRQGGSPLRHVNSVLDCWFESGSMPYAQWGYPAQNRDAFDKTFPADFIAEGLDQTRGWFYTLVVIGTALFGKAPFENVVVNGLILAEDGKKMSKSLRNYPDPVEVLDEHGADALRLYLIDSPVVKAQELRFSDKGVRDIVRKILLRWWNAYSFFVNYANVDGFRPQGDPERSPNILDQWILSRLHTLIDHTNREMDGYRLYNVVPALLQFIEELTNTYIRFNREHFWREGMPEDKRLAYETLYEVLLSLSKVMAPFTPFLAEAIYQNLTGQNLTGQGSAEGTRLSVHLEAFPEADPGKERPALEAAVARMNQLVLMGRNLRERLKIKAKIPLRTMRVIHRDPAVLEALAPLEPYFAEELNVREVLYASDEDTYIQVSAKAHFPRLGPRLGKRMKDVARAIAAFTATEIAALEQGETLEVAGESITIEDVEIRRAPREEAVGDWALSAHQMISIELDPTVTAEQEREGTGREIIRRVQMARKSADLALSDRIALELRCAGALREAAEAHLDDIRGETLASSLRLVDAAPAGAFTQEADIDGAALGIGFTVQHDPPA
ncbi:isoleucine--tRNA ligase [Haliangium sp.]|uniref:isoleucine--tRNA ligase n=1 Tax=Haliangium sp. TaxID=2663208 RepID=UPI003D12FBF8